MKMAAAAAAPSSALPVAAKPGRAIDGISLSPSVNGAGRGSAHASWCSPLTATSRIGPSLLPSLPSPPLV